MKFNSRCTAVVRVSARPGPTLPPGAATALGYSGRERYLRGSLTMLLLVAGCSGEVVSSINGDASTRDGARSAEAGASDGPRDANADISQLDASGGDAGPPGPCNAARTPVENPCVISDAYGVFVAPAASGGSDSTGDGTRTRPFATLGTGLTKAAAAIKRLHACGATYPEALSVGAALDGVQVYGGLECPVAADGGVADAGTVD